MQGYPQPKVHPQAMAAMQAGVGGLHRPMPQAPSVGPTIMPSVQRPDVTSHPAPVAKPQSHPKIDPSVAPHLMQLMLHLPRPQVARPAPPPPHAVGAAVLAHLLQLRGGR